MSGIGQTIAIGGFGLNLDRTTASGASEDVEIVERVLGGDVNAFSVLVQKYQDRIYSAVFNYVSNPEDAMDITQDAFLKAYDKLSRFNSKSAFYTWMYRIAVNTAIDFIRKRKIRTAESLDDEKFTETGFEPVSKDDGSDPQKALASAESARLLRTAIASLSDKLRIVLVLHDVEDLPQEQIAEILQIPVGTVKSRISRARMDLRKIIQQQGGAQL
jgi:RNA polymerase sigma-70 factor, ECF subfamily